MWLQNLKNNLADRKEIKVPGIKKETTEKAEIKNGEGGRATQGKEKVLNANQGS